jgi:hypothetical protein
MGPGRQTKETNRAEAGVTCPNPGAAFRDARLLIGTSPCGVRIETTGIGRLAVRIAQESS